MFRISNSVICTDEITKISVANLFYGLSADPNMVAMPSPETIKYRRQSHKKWVEINLSQYKI
jgi:hypothetical protein